MHAGHLALGIDDLGPVDGLRRGGGGVHPCEKGLHHRKEGGVRPPTGRAPTRTCVLDCATSTTSSSCSATSLAVAESHCTAQYLSMTCEISSCFRSKPHSDVFSGMIWSNADSCTRISHGFATSSASLKAVLTGSPKALLPPKSRHSPTATAARSEIAPSGNCPGFCAHL